MPGGDISAIKKSEARQKKNREGLRSRKFYFRDRSLERAFY